MNSINSARNRDDLINEILLTLNEDPETVAVLVEGPDDIEFFEKVFDGFENVACFESLSGYAGLYDLLRELPSPRIVAVRDKDYTDLTDRNQYPPRMFAYDDCALELMILHHPYAQRRLSRYYSRKEENFPLDLMRGIAAFSLLRQRNAREKLEIAFDDMGGVLAGHEKKKPLPPDMKSLFDEYEKNYPDKMRGLYEILNADAQSLPPERLWEITNGHDICKLLGILSALDKGALGEKGYFRLMIEVYQFQHFQDTYLYRKLSEHRLSNGTRPFAAS